MRRKNNGECIMPVPAEAPPMPTEHPKLGKPSGRWPYRDAAGRLLFEALRFDPAGVRKIFLPLSLWRDASGTLRWLWESVPAPRPLYGLDRLAANSGAPVVICEGEKSADEAARVFPKSVCMTSPGGCKAAAKANFCPLAGRRVLIWPDADEAGAKYAGEVARILHGLGCEVSIIDAVALSGMAPGGGSRAPVAGFDAADAIAEWPDIAVGQGRTLEFPEPEPWPEPVDGAELLDEIEAAFSRFAVCETAARDALVLWCCATWFEPVAQVAPILNITSPEMRCGKSLVLSIAAKLSKRPLPSSNISAAALFRTIEKHSPAAR
jgi:hypothetical protein